MNSLEKKIVLLLQDLKKNYSVVELKAELEAEGSRINELMRLKEIGDHAGMGIVLKVGGCEAITDMFEAQKIGVSGLIAPMIESAYAMKKYIMSVKKYFPDDLRKTIHFGAMIETVQGYKNRIEILNEDKEGLLDTLSLGRVDMSGSLGLARDEINTEKVYKIAEEVYTEAKKRNLRTVMGGGIAKEAIPFIKKLISKKLLDRFETRKIVFSTSRELSTSTMEEGIIKANLFELLWLQNKKRYYTTIAMEDDARIEMLMSRIYKINL